MMTSIERMRKNREEITGLSQKRILNMNLDAERRYMKNFIGEEVREPEKLDENSLNRGNPFMATGKIVSKNAIDSFIERIREKNRLQQ